MKSNKYFLLTILLLVFIVSCASKKSNESHSYIPAYDLPIEVISGVIKLKVVYNYSHREKDYEVRLMNNGDKIETYTLFAGQKFYRSLADYDSIIVTVLPIDNKDSIIKCGGKTYKIDKTQKLGKSFFFTY